MLARFSLLLRLGLIAALVPVMVSAPALSPVAHAWDDDDDDDGYDDDEDGPDEDQPPVTAGGLYTKQTYPITELERPLTLIKGMFEVRGGIDIDMSAKTAFEVWRTRVDARYGLQDNFELQAGFDALLAGTIATGNRFALYGGIEAAIAYDLVNFRVLAVMPVDPEFQFDIVLGFPFRYKVKPNVAIIALDKLMTIHTHSVPKVDDPEDPDPDFDPDSTEIAKPDLTVGVGIVMQLMPDLAVLLRGEITIPRFDTDFIAIPVTAALQFSPKNNVDIGGEFTFGNIKAENTFDSRFLLLFARLRM
jgi:hypothetical protein